jgi:hypothetical protein
MARRAKNVATDISFIFNITKAVEWRFLAEDDVVISPVVAAPEFRIKD